MALGLAISLLAVKCRPMWGTWATIYTVCMVEGAALWLAAGTHAGHGHPEEANPAVGILMGGS